MYFYPGYPPLLDDQDSDTPALPIPLPPNTDRTQNPAVGNTFQANWPEGTSGRIFWFNDSPYGHTIAFDSAGSTANGYYVPAYHARLITPFRPVNKITYSVDAASTLSGAAVAPLALLFIEYHPLDGLPGMPDQITPIAERLSNVGNTVNTPTSPANAVEQDLLTPFVLTGLAASKDGVVVNQLDVTAGIALLRQADQSVARQAMSATSFLTTVPSTTYFLDLNPDGTWSWGTAHSGVTNHLTIASATTDASGNILAVTDARTLFTTLFPGVGGPVQLTNQLAVTALFSPIQAVLSSPPVTDTLGVGLEVSGDTKERLSLYARGADGYGGLSGGNGNAPATAHLFAQALGWAIQEAIVSLGGQPTAGRFGVPPIVAQTPVAGVAVTSTAQQTILSFTPTTPGQYRVSGHVDMSNTSASKLVVAVNYASNLVSTATFMATGGFVFDHPLLLSGASTQPAFGPGSSAIALMPAIFFAKAGSPITCLFTDPTGVPNDHVWFTIEFLG